MPERNEKGQFVSVEKLSSAAETTGIDLDIQQRILDRGSDKFEEEQSKKVRPIRALLRVYKVVRRALRDGVVDDDEAVEIGGTIVAFAFAVVSSLKKREA